MILSTLLLAISGEAILYCLLWLAIAAVLFFLLNWAIAYVGISEPFVKPIKLIIVVLVIVAILNALLFLVGKPFISF